MKTRNLLIFFLIAGGLSFGFLQEYLKINVNYILETGKQIPGFFDMEKAHKKAWIENKKKNAPQDFYHKPKTIEFLYDLDESSLERLKWVNTIVFIGIFLLLNMIILRLATGTKKEAQWMLYFYLVFFVAAILIFAIGKVIGKPERTYMVSRKIVGALQSLVPLMILLPAILAAKKLNEKKHDSK